MGIKPLPHFENLLHTFAMKYKIKAQGNVETVCLLSTGMVDQKIKVEFSLEDMDMFEF